jgi:hypothetical protein
MHFWISPMHATCPTHLVLLNFVWIVCVCMHMWVCTCMSVCMHVCVCANIHHWTLSWATHAHIYFFFHFFVSLISYLIKCWHLASLLWPSFCYSTFGWQSLTYLLLICALCVPHLLFHSIFKLKFSNIVWILGTSSSLCYMTLHYLASLQINWPLEFLKIKLEACKRNITFVLFILKKKKR